MTQTQKSPLEQGASRRQTTAMNGPKIDPFKGVVKPDTLREHIRAAAAGNANSRSYVRGSFQYLERKPPNPFIVPILKKALERARAL